MQEIAHHYGTPDHSAMEPWRPALTQISTLFEQAQGDGKKFNQMLYEQFSNSDPVGLCFTVSLLATREATVAFRSEYTHILQAQGKKVKDIRDADIALSCIQINLSNWFLKNPQTESSSLEKILQVT
jgi:hypothetical protein